MQHRFPYAERKICQNIKKSQNIMKIIVGWLTQQYARDKKTKGNTVFLRKKKNSIKGKMDSLWTPRNIIPLDGSCYRSIGSSISQNIFSYLKMLSMQCKKIITIEDNKNRMNITNFINIYRNIYTYITCDKNDSK